MWLGIILMVIFGVVILYECISIGKALKERKKYKKDKIEKVKKQNENSSKND